MNAQIGFLLDLVMVFGPVLGYIPQYNKFLQRKSSEGFSHYISFILLVANILRIFFWFGKQFDTVLLAQSIVMIIAQLFMLELWIRLSPKDLILSTKRKRFQDFNLQYFWNWEDFPSYLMFLVSLVVSISFLTLLLIDFNWYVETLGFLALSIEALLGIPQMITNYRKGSTSGLSVEMVASWFIGDSFKSVYFLLNGAPIQFILCGTVQLIVDILIFYQIFTL